NRAATDLGSPALGAGQYSAVLAPVFDREAECGPEFWHGEQALDVQAIHTIAPAARIVYYGASSCFTLFDTLNTAVADNRASVISNSWSVPGESLEPPATRAQLDGIALQAAIQGQTLLFITGDTGDNRGAAGRVEPSWPASHPWVTAVGGTTVGLDQTNRIRFTAGWENTGNTQQGTAWVPQADADGPFAAGAGGGISTLYAQPEYQRAVVPDALAQGRRTVPDIAALADSYTGMRIGYTTSAAGFVEFASGGTSLAGPLLAGLVADAQQAQGVARMGFLNAALYALSGRPAITDTTPVRAGIWTPAMHTFGGVTVPSQPGSYLIDIDARPQSLQSAAGWDAVTGVGTPTSAFLTAIGR
ncbi:MAG TPA: S53 family peptidase, partial [Microlunatus sp.]|nr:S53 family peptidase [Microlunatus sp.]